jgi:hypothetical protein
LGNLSEIYHFTDFLSVFGKFSSKSGKLFGPGQEILSSMAAGLPVRLARQSPQQVTARWGL